MKSRNFSFLDTESNQIPQAYFQKIMSVLAAHQIAFWEYDLLSAEITLSKDFFRILGLEQIGIHFYCLEDAYSSFHPDDVETYDKAFSQMLEDRTKSSVISYRRVGKGGEIVWLEDHFLSYQRDDLGHPTKLVVYTVNVTSHKEKDHEIRRLVDYNKKIIEALREIIFIFDDNLLIVDVLVGKGITLHHSIKDLRGSNGREYYTPEVCDLFIKNIRACLADDETREIEYSYKIDDQLRYFYARIAPFGEHQVLALIHDITNRVRRSEELIEAKRRAEESDRMKTLFLANMSHEIRTPLNAIIGFSESIFLAETDEQRKEYLNIIQTNNKLLLQLINDILDLSRIESGDAEMYIQTVNLSELIADVGTVYRPKLSHEVKLDIVCPMKDIFILSDRNRLTQVLSNLLSNAVKNTEKGTITLGFTVDEEWAKLYVSDTGRGIPEDHLSLIFNRFEKLDHFMQGGGLGLSICKSIMERLGGRIEVESEVGVGSTFSVYLYWNAAESMVGKSVGKKKKILIVESSEVAYKELESTFNDRYELLWRIDGDKVLSTFLRESPSLVLINLNIAKLSGVQVIEKLRKISASVPIVAVTEHVYYTERQRALQAGCNEVMTKPYSLSRIKQVLESYLTD